MRLIRKPGAQRNIRERQLAALNPCKRRARSRG
jgi:hypothetical protein